MCKMPVVVEVVVEAVAVAEAEEEADMVEAEGVAVAVSEEEAVAVEDLESVEANTLGHLQPSHRMFRPLERPCLP